MDMTEGLMAWHRAGYENCTGAWHAYAYLSDFEWYAWAAGASQAYREYEAADVSGTPCCE